ncbi:ribbon-helix-helix domain-containing protein [Microvirga calopogonii]|uniref:ribbon-helix-helix domain-containing protein n=1 Tax=Microvirga calopogonii TaxID=2078013 RepID=UPI0013B3A267|nr:ribbon-helix-helix domain-containing protein [Microvirga calopogonii]
MMSVRQGLLVALVSVAGFGSSLTASADAATFTCPDTMAADRPGAASSLSDLYAGADDVTASNRLGELMADLRKSGMKPALIVDHLIGAYCPLVAADATLSDKQKADRVRRFARLVTGLAYVPSDADEVDVLVQTPLPPGLLSQVEQAAGRTGISRDEWIERAIRQQLSAP